MKANASGTTKKIKERIRIVEFTNPSGNLAYRVTGWDKDNKRVRINFKTYGEAQTHKQTLENEIENKPTFRHRWAPRCSTKKAIGNISPMA